MDPATFHPVPRAIWGGSSAEMEEDARCRRLFVGSRRAANEMTPGSPRTPPPPAMLPYS